MQIYIVQLANRSLQRRDGPTCRSLQNLQSDGRRKELHGALVGGGPDSLDPAALNHGSDDLAYCGPVHPQRDGEVRGLDPGVFSDCGQRTMHADRSAGHLLQFAVQAAHAINQGASRKQHDPLPILTYRGRAGRGVVASSHCRALDGWTVCR
ncbi:MAG: hypothetical protein IPM70_12505 [Proteobacteria bacterium]|nr:hypothetical protein [Pseudomonadota bacterium]MBK9252646.1 hypothetical protein [Pseudomonadota bacterium]